MKVDNITKAKTAITLTVSMEELNVIRGALEKDTTVAGLLLWSAVDDACVAAKP